MTTNRLIKIGEVRGVNIYREPNAAGGYSYYADDIGGGRMCYDTCLDDDEIIKFCQEDSRKLPAPDKKADDFNEQDFCDIVLNR